MSGWTSHPLSQWLCFRKQSYVSTITWLSSRKFWTHCSHLESLESSERHNTRSFIGFWHFSPTMHKHASIPERLPNLQEQFHVHIDILQQHAINSMMPFGAFSFVISTGTRLSSSIFQPWPSGEGRFWIVTRALFQMCVWKFALLMWWWWQAIRHRRKLIAFLVLLAEEQISHIICFV